MSPGSGGQVDLLVIGPTGIFVVTVIPGWRASAGTAVYAGAIPLRGAAKVSWRLAQAVADALAEGFPEWAEIAVRPLVAITSTRALPLGLDAVLDVPVLPHRELRGWIQHSYPRIYADLHVAALTAAAETLLPAAVALTNVSGWLAEIGVDETPSQ